MNVGEVNRGMVALLVVMLLGASGYLWHLKLYKPAVVAKETAVQSSNAAQQELSAARAELAQAQARIEEAKKGASGKVDDAVSRLAKSRTAVPNKTLLDDATIVLQDAADKSGIRTHYKAGSDDGAVSAEPADAGASLNGATAIDLEFKAVGTDSEMKEFIRRVEETAEVKNGKLYTRGRLFNVVKLTIGGEDEASAAGGDFSSGDVTGAAEDANELKPRGNEMLFTVIVRMYTSSTENAEAVGAETPDDLAEQPLDDAAASGAGTGTEPNADGTAGTTDGAAAGDGATGTGAPAGAADGATGTDGGV